jgi:hypothetical protein
MNDMYIWLSSPEQAAAVNAAIWLSLVLSVVWMAVQAFNTWRWRRSQVRRTVAAAKAQARLAVFDSWLRAGGWMNDLTELAYDGFLREYREMAEKHGVEYFSEFCEELELAQVELDKTLYRYQQEIIRETKSDA